MSTPTILTEIKKSKSRTFRALHVKRRLAATGLFESTWQDLTTDVKRWGTIKKSVDDVGYSRFRFSDLSLTMANDYGRYNPEDNVSSFWYGYASQQRTLVRIQAGFLHQTLGANGIWTNTTLPADPAIFYGVIQGDLNIGDSNEVLLTVKPLTQVFRDFSCRNLSGLTVTGMTGSQFIATLRDQTDGAGNLVFRPFFNDTTTWWEFTSSSIVYVDISPNIASARPYYGATQVQNDFLEMNVWEALEKLGEAENLVPRITRDGKFRFADRSRNTATAAFHFYGRGFHDFDYGLTLKKINSFKKKVSDFYSRVEVKWQDLPTTTAIVSTQTAMVVNGTNTAWLYGHRTFKMENYWIATATSAQSLANSLFTAIATVPQQIDFTASLVPHLDILDLVTINYDSTQAVLGSRWDINDWAYDSTTTANDLIFANPEGDALSFVAREFKLTSISVDLEKMESQFVGIAI